MSMPKQPNKRIAKTPDALPIHCVERADELTLTRVERQVDRCRWAISALAEVITYTNRAIVGGSEVREVYDLDNATKIALHKEAGKLLALLAREGELTKVKSSGGETSNR